LEKKFVKAMGSIFSGSINWYQGLRMQSYRRLAPWLGKFDEAEWRNAAIEKDFPGSIVSGC
jgi:hypothetical protein